VKKALGVFALMLLLVPFSVADAALVGQQPELNFIVASSTSGPGSNGNILFWIGTGDGQTVIDSISFSAWTADPGVTVQVRYTCFANLATSSAASQSGCSNMSAVSSNVVSLVAGGPDIAPVYTAYFTDDTPLQNGKYYAVEYLVTGTNWHVRGSSSQAISGQCSYQGTASCLGSPLFLYNTTFSFSGNQGTATSSSFFSGQDATTTLQALQDQCSQAGNIFAEGICIAFSFLFVPQPSTIGQFQNLELVARSRIPFSYVYSIEDAFQNITLNATSSMPLINIPLSNVASSTLTGVIPDISLSTSTISTYLPDSVRLALRALIIALIWLLVGWLLFGEAMRVFGNRKS